MIIRETIVDAVCEAVITASTKFRKDQIQVYEKAIEHETNKNARWVLERILENSRIADEERRFPMCNDTGIPHAFVEIGRDFEIPSGFFDSIKDGVVKGERKLPTRPMAVKGDPMERLAQSKGLYDDPGMLEPTPIVVETIPGNNAYITILMLGGGPEIRARTYRVYHHKDGYSVLKQATNWAIEGVAQLGCTPCVPAIGIGRTHYEATVLMIRALRNGQFDKQNEMEKMIVERINETNVGPLGVGGATTALGSFIEIGPQRASGTRVVCMRLGCCYDPRRAIVKLP